MTEENKKENIKAELDRAWYGYDGGQLSYTEDVEVDVTWTGLGNIMCGHNNYHSYTSGPWGRVISLYRSNGSYRDAQATGSFSGNMGTNITLDQAFSSSQIYKSKYGTMFISVIQIYF